VNIEYFFVVVAWALAPMLSLWSALIVYFAMTYEGSTQHMVDRMMNVRRTYTVGYAPLVAVVLWAYIIAYYFG
jgi:hypothetical protein